MKKLSQIVTAALVAALVVYAGVVTYVAESKPVLPPEGSRFNTAMYITWTSAPMSLPELASEADCIAHIRVGDWLGESSYHGTSYFEAAALNVFKGDLPEKFVLGQSSHIVPIFTYGNELFLFMIQASDTEYDVVYRTADGDRTISYVAYDADGDAYIVPHQYNRALSGFVGGGASHDRAALKSYLVQNDPELWLDRDLGRVLPLESVVERISEILAASSTEPPALSVSADGETLDLEPREFSWSSQSGEYESPNAAHPLLLSDEEWNALPYLDGEPSEIEFLCDLEPSNIHIVGFHESYRGVDDPTNTILVQRIYVRDDDEDGAFEIDSSSGYVYVASVSWNENSESPLCRGSAQYAFRVGETKEIAPEQVALSSFDAYPTPQLSNTLKDSARADILARFGKPDISQESYDLWLTESEKYVRVRYLHPDYDSVLLAESLLGLSVFPPLSITIGGESYPVRRGTTTWHYTIEGKHAGGYELDSSAPGDWDWSEATIYTDATEAVITLDVSERLAERMDVSIDGGLISAETVGETFELPGGSAKIYEFRVHVSDAAAEGSDALFSGSSRCAVRIAPSGDKPQ